MQSRFVFRAARLKAGYVALLLASCGDGANAPGAAQAGAGPTQPGGRTSSGSSGASGSGSASNGVAGSSGASLGGSAAGAPTSGGAAGAGPSAGGSAGSPNATGGGNSLGGMGASAGSAGAGSDGPLPPSVTSLFPKPGASGVCLDAPLTMTFAAAPTLGSKGTISIYAKASPSTIVDQIEIGAAS
ncbi:MAG TPA: Ig-like domain-containing protein, partial [Polyangiaceae bacterium]